MTCHRATQMGIGEHRNRDMVPTAEVRSRLQDIWCHLKLFVVEEVSMVSPNLHNMPLYRVSHARKEQCYLSEAKYQTPACAFGRVPIVLDLGDFLQAVFGQLAALQTPRFALDQLAPDPRPAGGLASLY